MQFLNLGLGEGGGGDIIINLKLAQEILDIYVVGSTYSILIFWKLRPFRKIPSPISLNISAVTSSKGLEKSAQISRI